MRRDWANDLPEIRRLAEQEKMSAAMIAERFSVTRNSIIGVCNRNSIQLPGLSPEAHRAKSVRRDRKLREPAAAKPRKPKPCRPTIEVVPPMPVPLIPAEPVKFGDLRILSLGGVNQCRSFLPGESGVDGLVCADATPPGQPWCPACRALYYRPLRSKVSPQRINLHSQWSGAKPAWA
jgi:hypothetical protein